MILFCFVSSYIEARRAQGLFEPLEFTCVTFNRAARTVVLYDINQVASMAQSPSRGINTRRDIKIDIREWAHITYLDTSLCATQAPRPHSNMSRLHACTL